MPNRRPTREKEAGRQFTRESVTILAIGDVIGKPGREALRNSLPDLREMHEIDLIIANGENAAGGFGLTPETANEMFDSGVDVITSGNHIWAQKEILPSLDTDMPVLRPLNYPVGVPGRGCLTVGPVMVINLIGTTFMDAYDNPFHVVDKLLNGLDNKPPIIVIDFHAEATSEKQALGHFLDGRVSAVLGTHTHVGTIDARILPGGTAYVTDIGMTGPDDSVIGDEIAGVMQRFLTKMPHHLTVGSGKAVFNGILIKVSSTTGHTTEIERINIKPD